jgi:hypothetical protein
VIRVATWKFSIAMSGDSKHGNSATFESSHEIAMSFSILPRFCTKMTPNFRGFFAMVPLKIVKIATKHGNCHVSGNPDCDDGEILEDLEQYCFLHENKHCTASVRCLWTIVQHLRIGVHWREKSVDKWELRTLGFPSREWEAVSGPESWSFPTAGKK